MPQSRIRGLELDEVQQPIDTLGRISRGVDFLVWTQRHQREFDKIISNPPYIQLGKLDPALRRSALNTPTPEGIGMRLGANYWYAFLCASLTLLKPGGALSFVLPAAWDYSDYAAPLRELLPRSFDEFEVHRCLKPMFPNRQDGCVIIVGKGFRTPSNGRELRYEYESPHSLVKGVQSKRNRSSRIVSNQSISSPPPPGEDECLLRNVAVISLGGVTGDSKDFLLSES